MNKILSCRFYNRPINRNKNVISTFSSYLLVHPFLPFIFQLGKK